MQRIRLSHCDVSLAEVGIGGEGALRKFLGAREVRGIGIEIAIVESFDVRKTG